MEQHDGAHAANQLTLLRLLLAPVFALAMLYGHPGWALITFSSPASRMCSTA